MGLLLFKHVNINIYSCILIQYSGFGRDYETIDLDEKYTEDTFIFECNCPAFHWITRNPLYFDKLRRLGAIPPESAGSSTYRYRHLPLKGVPKEDYSFYVASWIAKMFFGKANPKFQTAIDEYINSWNTQKSFVIGLQIRVGGNGDAEFMNEEELELAMSCAQNLSKVGIFVNKYIHFKGHENVSYLVVSDNTNAINNITNYFGKDKVIVVSGTPKHVAFQQVEDSDVMKLVIDNWLLSK